jgi:hypothetical protein
MVNDMSAVELDENDEQILELAALQAPWYMICGEFHRRYGGPGALAWRLYELQNLGLVEVRSSVPHGVTPNVQRLEADALAHDCYDHLDATHDPQWEIVTTDMGMEAIRGRLEPE